MSVRWVLAGILAVLILGYAGALVWMAGVWPWTVVGAVVPVLLLTLFLLWRSERCPSPLPRRYCPEHGEWYGDGNCPTCDRATWHRHTEPGSPAPAGGLVGVDVR
jgi:hypothetical protein